MQSGSQSFPPLTFQPVPTYSPQQVFQMAFQPTAEAAQNYAAGNTALAGELLQGGLQRRLEQMRVNEEVQRMNAMERMWGVRAKAQAEAQENRMIAQDQQNKIFSLAQILGDKMPNPLPSEDQSTPEGRAAYIMRVSRMSTPILAKRYGAIQSQIGGLQNQMDSILNPSKQAITSQIDTYISSDTDPNSLRTWLQNNDLTSYNALSKALKGGWSFTGYHGPMAFQDAVRTAVNPQSLGLYLNQQFNRLATSGAGMSPAQLQQYRALSMRIAGLQKAADLFGNQHPGAVAAWETQNTLNSSPSGTEAPVIGGSLLNNLGNVGGSSSVPAAGASRPESAANPTVVFRSITPQATTFGSAATNSMLPRGANSVVAPFIPQPLPDPRLAALRQAQAEADARDYFQGSSIPMAAPSDVPSVAVNPSVTFRLLSAPAGSPLTAPNPAAILSAAASRGGTPAFNTGSVLNGAAAVPSVLPAANPGYVLTAAANN